MTVADHLDPALLDEMISKAERIVDDGGPSGFDVLPPLQRRAQVAALLYMAWADYMGRVWADTHEGRPPTGEEATEAILQAAEVGSVGIILGAVKRGS